MKHLKRLALLLLVLLGAACGPRRVAPATYLLDAPALPEYERTLDHARLITSLDKDG